MFDIVTLTRLAEIGVETTARAEGRAPTNAEYETAVREVWDDWMAAAVSRDMVCAGFIKTETGWQKPRSLWSRIFGQTKRGNHMRTLILTAAVLAIAVPAAAQTTCQTFGNQTYCNGPNGYRSTSQTFGDSTYIREQNGASQRNTTCQQFGNQLYCR